MEVTAHDPTARIWSRMYTVRIELVELSSEPTIEPTMLQLPLLLSPHPVPSAPATGRLLAVGLTC